MAGLSDRTEQAVWLILLPEYNSGYLKIIFGNCCACAAGVWRMFSWIHEREWKCKGDFEPPMNPFGVLVKTVKDAEKLQKLIHAEPKEFAAMPRSIIPLDVICQGLAKF